MGTIAKDAAGAVSDGQDNAGGGKDTAGAGADARDSAGAGNNPAASAGAGAVRESKPNRKRRGQGSKKNKLKSRKTTL